MDLSLREGGRFLNRVASTARFCRAGGGVEDPMDEQAVPVVRDTADLAALLEGEDVIPDDLPAFDDEDDDEAEPSTLAEGDLFPPTQPDLHGLSDEPEPRRAAALLQRGGRSGRPADPPERLGRGLLG